jgi:hypothetical protein
LIFLIEAICMMIPWENDIVIKSEIMPLMVGKF